MKKTENISLAGYAFTIENDAYDELGTYLNEISRVFANDASAEEITADIESRVAELIKEKYVSGMVVDLNMVKEIERRIGDPKELAREDVDDSYAAPAGDKETEQKKSWKTRRMYRNMEERVIGGVCSGLAAYFGMDKVLFRILFLIFFTIGFLGIDEGPYFGFSVLAYICLWIAMPAARTDDQKREMKGRPTKLESYRTKDFTFGQEVKDVANSPAGETVRRAGGVFLGILLLITGLTGMLLCIILPSIPAFVGHQVMEHIQMYGPLNAEEKLLADLATEFWWVIMIMLGIFFVWFLYNGVMLLFNLKYPSWRPGLILFIAWIVSLFVCLGTAIKMAADAFLPIVI